MQVQVPMVANNICRQMYKRIGDAATAKQFGDRVVCAGKENHSTCSGDSGGPLMLPFLRNGKFQFYQIGSVAYAEGMDFATFTNCSSYFFFFYMHFQLVCYNRLCSKGFTNSVHEHNIYVGLD